MNSALLALAQWWLSVLPMDAAGRRVFDETLADWRREVAKASGPLIRFVVSLRAVFSVLRCVAGVTVLEAVSSRRSALLTRVFLFVAGYLAVANVLLQLAPGISAIAVLSRLYSQVALVAYVFPVALLFGTALGSKRRTVPALGLGLVACLSSVALLGWGMPLANRALLGANPGTARTGSGPIESVPNKLGEGLAMAMGTWKTKTYLPTPLFMNDLTIRQLRCWRRCFGAATF